jgi:hypothetical protein
VTSVSLDLTDFFSHARLLKVYKLNKWRVVTASRFLPRDWDVADVEVQAMGSDVIILTFHRVTEQKLNLSDLE